MNKVIEYAIYRGMSPISPDGVKGIAYRTDRGILNQDFCFAEKSTRSITSALSIYLNPMPDQWNVLREKMLNLQTGPIFSN